MTKHFRMASGLAGLGLIVTLGAGVAQAESIGRYDAATTVRASSTAPATASRSGTSGTKTASAAGKAKTDAATTGKAYGFTGSAGTKTFRLTTTQASASNSAKAGATRSAGSYGRADTASFSLGNLFKPKGTSKTSSSASASGMTRRPYHAQIEKHARAAGVPVALALAVVRVESNYNPKVRGRAGEIGLMQIKPQTARGMGFSGSSNALYDPETNLRWGMKYLAGAYQRAGGDTCGTIMRYQGGHYAKRMSKVAVGYCAKVKRHMAGKWA